MWSGRDLLFKILLPICVLGIILYGMITRIGLDSAEIPILQDDPALLHEKPTMCIPNTEKTSSTEKALSQAVKRP